MPSKLSDKVLVVLITVIGSVTTSGITTFGVIESNSHGIAQNQVDLQKQKAQIANLGKPVIPVGTVVASLLTPAEFAKEVGDPDNFDPTRSNWTLANGKAVPGTNWATLRGNASLPDLNGVFLRGKKNTDNRPELAKVEEVELGGYRPDTVGPHKHKVWIENKADQKVTGFRYNGDGTGTFGYTDMMPMSDEAPETQPKSVTINYFIKINDFSPKS